MRLCFTVPPTADGVLLRSFLRACAVSTDLARAVKFHGSGFFADGVPILANRRVEVGQVISFTLPADGAGVAPQPEIPAFVHGSESWPRCERSTVSNSHVRMMSCAWGRRSIGKVSADSSGSVSHPHTSCGVSEDVAQVSITSESPTNPPA